MQDESKKLKKTISIVSPAYNEAENVSLMAKEILEVIKKLEDKYDFEIIFVDDGSDDETWNNIMELNKNDPRVKGLSFARNFGHQIALTAGLDATTGDAVIYCDSDLQHPPELFKEMIKKWEEGFKVVHTVRTSTDSEPLSKKVMSKAFYRFINMLSDVRIEQDMADFKLLDRTALDKLNSMREHNRFLRGMVPWIGYKPAYVKFIARKRIHGKPWYSFRKNLTFAKTGILSFSVKPLKYIGYLGLFLMSTSVLAICVGLAMSVITKGWYFSPNVTLTLFNTFLIGVVLTSLGIMSLYLSYVYYEVIGRPLYIISDKTP